MSDPMNGKHPPATNPAPGPDPQQISTEVYLLDALVAHAQTVANQFVFRGKPELGQALAQLMAPVWQFRMQVDANTRSGIVLLGPGALPRV